MTESEALDGELILYQTEDGRTRIECRFEGETVWLTQVLMAELFDIGVGTVNHHLKEAYAEGELAPEATIRRRRIVRTEGNRSVSREIEHYNLDAILAVGFRVLGGNMAPIVVEGSELRVRASNERPMSYRSA